MPVVGIILAVLVDLVVPTALLVWLVRANSAGRRSDRGERVFWAWFGPIIGIYALAIVASLDRIFAFEGQGVVIASIFALPASGIPAAFNSTVIHYFFSTAEWAAFGYFIVTSVYTIGLIAWAALPALAIRRINQRAATPRKR